MRLFPVLVSVVLLALPHVVVACPTCVDALAAQQAPSNAQQGLAFSYSVLFMLAVPGCMLLGFGLFVTRFVLRADRDQLHLESSEMTS